MNWLRKWVSTGSASPNTNVKGLKEFHERCGIGAVDLGFQHSGTDYAEVKIGIELFGREVLPQIKQF